MPASDAIAMGAGFHNDTQHLSFNPFRLPFDGTRQSHAAKDASSDSQGSGKRNDYNEDGACTLC